MMPVVRISVAGNIFARNGGYDLQTNAGLGWRDAKSSGEELLISLRPRLPGHPTVSRAYW